MAGNAHASLSKANVIDITSIIHPHTQSTLFVRGALWVRVRTKEWIPDLLVPRVKYNNIER